MLRILTGLVVTVLCLTLTQSSNSTFYAKSFHNRRAILEDSTWSQTVDLEVTNDYREIYTIYTQVEQLHIDISNYILHVDLLSTPVLVDKQEYSQLESVTVGDFVTLLYVYQGNTPYILDIIP